MRHAESWRCHDAPCQTPAGRAHHGCTGQAQRAVWKDLGETLHHCPLSEGWLGGLTPALKLVLRYHLTGLAPAGPNQWHNPAVFMDALESLTD